MLGDVHVGDVADLADRLQLAPVLDLVAMLVVHRVAGLDRDLARLLAARLEALAVLVVDSGTAVALKSATWMPCGFTFVTGLTPRSGGVDTRPWTRLTHLRRSTVA